MSPRMLYCMRVEKINSPLNPSAATRQRLEFASVPYLTKGPGAERARGGTRHPETRSGKRSRRIQTLYNERMGEYGAGDLGPSRVIDSRPVGLEMATLEPSGDQTNCQVVLPVSISE